MSDERLVYHERRTTDIQQQHLSRYRFAGSFVKDKRVIDVACGTGYGSAMLADRGAARVVGVDLSAGSIETASREWKRHNVEFRQGDAAGIGDIGPFDVAVSFETIEHLEHPEVFLDAIRTVLVPDGLFLVSTPERSGGSINDRPENPFHIREWNRPEFMELLQRHFGSVALSGQYAMVKRGFPFSMTIQRLIASKLHPGTQEMLYSFPVMDAPPSVPGFSMRCIYMVGVCTQPRPGGVR